MYVLVEGSNGEVYNIGGDEEITVKQVADLVASTVGLGRAVEYGQHPDKDYVTDNPQRRCPDLSRIRALAPFTTPIGLKCGLLRTARWGGLEASS
jgi:dTDP-glucose 4,6-dehydratase/UDP-glucuronate decarboxylase